MSLPRQLYKLQQIDIELQREQQALSKIENQLNDSRALAAAESKLALQKQELGVAKKEQKSTEWELENLQEKANHVNNKLYSGTTKNPKELVNLENEARSLKSKIGDEENELLELMSQGEELEAKVKISTGELQLLKQEWQQRQEKLNREKAEIEAKLVELSGSRQALTQQINSDVLGLYEQIKLTRGQAVAKVEQGRCQGCHITLPTSQWQRVKADELVQCSSCNRILYLV
ncbi:MAG: hypothetical protein JW732_08150 [Dehalococcoidia bacterium]|nr:hypothetical protein [Dehalococcoidia bacterium]